MREDQLSPKSVVRDMFERAMTFTEYVSLLRAGPRPRGWCCATSPTPTARCAQTVPDEAETEELDDLIEWLGELVRQVDSSLLDEWEELTDPAPDAGRRRPRSRRAGLPLTGNVRAFRVLVRNALFRRVELAALRRYDVLGELDAGAGWDAEAWREAMEPYFAEYDRHRHRRRRPRAGAAARRRASRSAWLVRQVFDDPEGDHDWGITAEVDLAASDEAGEPVVHRHRRRPAVGLRVVIAVRRRDAVQR